MGKSSWIRRESSEKQSVSGSAQGVEDVGGYGVQVVAARVADEGALSGGLLAGLADQGVARVVRVDDQDVGALEFLDVEVAVF